MINAEELPINREPICLNRTLEPLEPLAAAKSMSYL
jgi:hypothetical protein